MLPDFQFHHIGIATGSIENTAQYYLEAGYVSSEVFFDQIQNVSVAFLEKIGMPRIELITPPQYKMQTNDNSPVSKMIKEYGVLPYHICYEVEY